MNRILSQLIGFSRRILDEPEAVRRRWAKALFWGSLPVVALAWWLSLHYSLVERTALDAARSAVSGASSAATDVFRGFENLRVTFGTIRSVVENELAEEQSAPDDRDAEQFTLPIVE